MIALNRVKTFAADDLGGGAADERTGTSLTSPRATRSAHLRAGQPRVLAAAWGRRPAAGVTSAWT